MKKKITLTFDCDISEQAIVYEYIKNKGRSKTKAVTNVLLREAEKEDAFILMKEQLIQAVLSDERLQKVVSMVNSDGADIKEEQKKKITSLKKPKPKEDNTREEQKEEEIDYDSIMKGLEAFGI